MAAPSAAGVHTHIKEWSLAAAAAAVQTMDGIAAPAAPSPQRSSSPALLRRWPPPRCARIARDNYSTGSVIAATQPILAVAYFACTAGMGAGHPLLALQLRACVTYGKQRYDWIRSDTVGTAESAGPAMLIDVSHAAWEPACSVQRLTAQVWECECA